MKLGCLVPLAVLVLLGGEAASFAVVSHLLATYARDLVGGPTWVDTVLPILLLQVALTITGVVIVKVSVAALPLALMGTMMGQGQAAGRHALRLFAGILLILPGFFLDLVALVLLLPPVQRLFATLGQKVVMSLVRRQMGKMFAGGAGGMGAAGAGFPFPGMRPRGPLVPDAQARGGKVVDVTAERVDP